MTRNGGVRRVSPASSRATMHDVAALAGVSAKTVSRVVNRQPGVSAEVLARVTAAIDRLNYRHNLAASQLRSGQGSAAAIAVVLVDISNPFSSTLHRVVEDASRERGVVLLAASTDEDAARERAAVEAFSARRVDGLIIMPSSHDQSYLLTELAAGTKIVMVDRPPSFLDVDAVVSDNTGGAADGVAHLVAHGHRRIGYIGDRPDVLSSQQRHDGYLRALAAARVDVDPSLIYQGLPGPAEVMDAVRAMMRADDPPTALFLGQNLICAPTVRALQELGMERSVAVVGFDGFEGDDLVDPGLTTVCQDTVEIARQAADLMFARLDGDADRARVRVLPVTLTPRGSGEIPGPYA